MSQSKLARVLRKRAAGLGFQIVQTRGTKSVGDQVMFMILDRYRNAVVIDGRFDMTPYEVSEFLDQQEANARPSSGSTD
jgi:hypothetical protein